MDSIVYDALKGYFNALEKKGYMPYSDAIKLLVLMFYNKFVYTDYYGHLSNDDYRLIERALNCLFGSTCLIPYPDYLKMGKLHLGEITEISLRVKALEDTDVLKAFDADGSGDSDIVIMAEKEED